jgi:hypothetical protein
MKLDFEALAKEVGIELHWGVDDNGDSKQYYDAWPEQLEAFARLIVERCAVEVESLGPQGPLKLVTDGFAIAIRNLLEDK